MDLVLSRKLQNAIKKVNPNGDYEFFLKNIIINGSKRGCSGFVRSVSNNSVVYVDTELTTLILEHPFMYRYADNVKDYTGYHNRWADSLEDLSRNVVALLKQTPVEANDVRF